MANTTLNPNVLTDPGFLFWSPLGTAAPTHQVTASKFTDSWPAGWINLGGTKEGTDFSYQTSFDGIEVAEFLLAIKQVATGAEGSVKFELADITAANLKRVFNGGALTVTGATTTTLTKFTPPVLGQEVRAQIGWESLDATVRYIVYQTVNTAAVEFGPNKGTDYATLPAEFTMEFPSSGVPFEFWTAGTVRG